VLARPSLLRFLWAALGAVFVVTSAAAAQVALELAPYAGVYIPTQPLVDGFPSCCHLEASLKQNPSVTLGGRLTVWWASRLGLEGTFAYSPSGVSVGGFTQPVADSSAHVTTVSVRMVVRMSPTGGSPWFRQGGGIGGVFLGGGAYESVGGLGRFAGVVSAGTAFKLGRGASALSLRLDAEEYLSAARLDAISGSTPCHLHYLLSVCEVISTLPPTRKFTDDLVLSVGQPPRLEGGRTGPQAGPNRRQRFPPRGE